MYHHRNDGVFNVPSSPSRGWTAPVLKKTTVVHKEDITVEEERVSIMFSVLPTSIQNRLPPLGSLRKRVTAPMWAGITSSTFSDPNVTTPTTPKSEVEATAVMDISETAGALKQGAYDKNLAFSQAKNLASSLTFGVGPAATPTTSGSGVNWIRGGQGLQLLLTSAQQATCGGIPSKDAQYERMTYINSLQYLLNGLPDDLGASEAAMLRLSMPTALAETLPGAGTGVGTAGVASGRQRNFVHSILLFLLMLFNSWIHWITPYCLLLFGKVLRYERRYKVAEKVMANTGAGISLAIVALRSMGDGAPGQTLSRIIEYTAQGVSGALSEFADQELVNRRTPGRDEP
ncbi:hypothetical protein B0H66DRAFT_239864 [Apodospora peruviana]|uniref:Uncharacterized protein n=1 Tax=Apodospora peruviana TaxID=516989 RepID=A0AAE0I4K7_9PEZI|nr:hypothetical protein B0H66DRAFT_239864 [Apodospora peruviana]